MNLFRKQQKLVDERIENAKNKIWKEAYILAEIICLISILAKSFIYNGDISRIITEISVMIVTSIYGIIRSVYTGIYSDEVEIENNVNRNARSTKNVIVGIVSGVIIGALFGARSAFLYAHSMTTRIEYFIAVFLITCMMYTPVFLIFLIGTDSISNRISKKQSAKEKDE